MNSFSKLCAIRYCCSKIRIVEDDVTLDYPCFTFNIYIRRPSRSKQVEESLVKAEEMYILIHTYKRLLRNIYANINLLLITISLNSICYY